MERVRLRIFAAKGEFMVAHSTRDHKSTKQLRRDISLNHMNLFGRGLHDEQAKWKPDGSASCSEEKCSFGQGVFDYYAHESPLHLQGERVREQAGGVNGENLESVRRAYEARVAEDPKFTCDDGEVQDDCDGRDQV